MCEVEPNKLASLLLLSGGGLGGVVTIAPSEALLSNTLGAEEEGGVGRGTLEDALGRCTILRRLKQSKSDLLGCLHNVQTELTCSPPWRLCLSIR